MNNDSKILRRFAERLDGLYIQMQGRDGITSKLEKGCITIDAVKNFMAPFARNAAEPFAEGTDAECCPYPLVERLIVAYSSSVLSKGNILTDGPGVGDRNTAYVDRAIVALKNADKIMIVSEMKRCVAVQDLLPRIRLALKRRGPEGIILVITRSAVSFRQFNNVFVSFKLIDL